MSTAIELVRGNIVTQDVDAVVTAANVPLRGGGVVYGAIHAGAGPQLLRACRELAPCAAGSAVVTPSFNLSPAQWVIHAVGPIYNGPEDAETLAGAYRAALKCADEVGARSVAFPAISTGVYGYPLTDAARVSVAALRGAITEVSRIVLVAYGEDTYQAWAAALEEEG